MNLFGVVAELRALATRIETAAPGQPVGAPTPALASSVTFTYYDAPGGKRRIDDVMPTGTPGTVTLPKLGHTLSLPQPQDGEMLPGYALRVCLQAGSTIEKAVQMNGALFLGTSNFHMNGDGSVQYWPGIADEFYNREAYQTDAEKTDFAAANAHISDEMNRVKPGPYPAATATMQDSNFLLAVDPYYRAHVSNRSVWQDALGGTQVEINRVIGMTGGGGVDWEMKAAYNAANGPLVAIVDKLIANGGVWVA